MHDNSDHCRCEGTYQQVTNCYWWEGLYKDVQRHVRTCKKCQHRAPFRKEEELHPTYVSTAWEKVEVDIVHLPPSEGCHYLIMTQDDLSGWLEWCTLNNVTAEAVAKFLYQNIFCCHSCLQRFIMNGGPENKREVEELLKQYEVRKVIVSAYHLQVNRMIKQEHTSIVQALVKACSSRFTQWKCYMHSITWADRSMVQKSINMSPYQFLHNKNPVLLIELSIPTWSTLP